MAAPAAPPQGSPSPSGPALAAGRAAGSERWTSSPAEDRPGERVPKRPRLADCVTEASAGSGEWAEVISALQPAIVALKVTCVRSFEEDPASTALGTGFVVDKERGLILTNRHIVGVGPVRAIAIFDRHEELEVEVLYRDPIHDFGFFRYDPSKLRLTRSAEVPLDPEGLRVGAEIRVVGNDAGEKLQILSGTIARVDRNVPEFHTVYNDENTFYAGAGAGTSGGSSGSPVLNKQGRAIALNAAGQEGTASAFFLPLHRVRYSLELLREGRPVPRGTCMTAFLFKPFDELIRVGLREKHEQEVLAELPDATGMLIVDCVLSEQKQLRPGDILLRLEGSVCVGFAELEAVLDSHVGSSVNLLVCRGGKELQLEVPVADLHALIPRTFVELGLDVLHQIGYHAARRAHLPLDTGMYLARSGFVFDSLGCGRASVITSVGEVRTPTAEALVEALTKIADRQHFPVSWYELMEFRRDRTLKTGFAKMSRAWSPLRLWRCRSSGGNPERWEPTDLPPPPKPPKELPLPGHIVAASGGDKLVRRLQGSLVTVRFRTDRRFCTEASFTGASEGVGVLVDDVRGLVLTDRHSAPQSLGDVEVTLAGSTTVDGEVVFIHPLHNLAIIRCDPAAYNGLREAKVPISAARLATGNKASLRPGEAVNFVGFDNQGNAFSTRANVSAVYLPSGRDEFPLWDVPRFRERNLEIVVLADTPEDARGGVLCDEGGAIRALFAAFDWQGPQREETTEAFGVPTGVFASWVEAARFAVDVSPQVLSLDVELNAVDVATLTRGTAGRLPREWLQAVTKRCGDQGQVPRALRVHRLLPLGASEGQLKPGDVLLAVNGHIVACCTDLEEALAKGPGKAAAAPKAAALKRPAAASAAVARRPAAAQRHLSIVGAGASASTSTEGVTIRVFRQGAEVEVTTVPRKLGSEDDDRLLLWAGLVLRRTPRCALERCGDAAKRAGSVFVQSILGGSPADARELGAHCFLMELDGHPIHALGDVLFALSQPPAASPAPSEGDTTSASPAPAGEVTVPGRRWVRLLFVDLCGQEHVRALQCDPLFFPTLDLRRSPQGRWHCTTHAY